MNSFQYFNELLDLAMDTKAFWVTGSNCENGDWLVTFNCCYGFLIGGKAVFPVKYARETIERAPEEGTFEKELLLLKGLIERSQDV